MLTFTGGDGVEWRVWEVTAPEPESPPFLIRRPEFARGWLLFESSAERRRLAPYPENWRSLSLRELERCCRQAKAVGVGGAPGGALERAG